MKTIRFGLVVSCLVAVSAFSVRAQDVTVSDPLWFDAATPPEVLPALKSKLRPDYPERFAETVSGYVLVGVSIDVTGKRAGTVMRATFPEFQERVSAALNEVSFKPAQVGGSPAASQVWLSVIFNAANASPKKADAKPRLLAVTPAVITRELKAQPGAIWANVSLDEQGVPQKFVLENAAFEDFRPDLEQALKAWKFAPARKGGIPVAAETRVAFFVVAPTTARPPSAGTPPKAIRRVPPVYPLAMRQSGMVGEVVVGFEVDVKGNATKVAVVSSNNAAFEAAALESVKQWKFEPGTKDGKPVATKMEIPLKFKLIDAAGQPGREAVEVKKPTKEVMDNMPPQYRFDVAPKATKVVLPVYPYAFLRDGVKGKATVAALIDDRGRVTQIAVIEASHPEFGQALAAAFSGYGFEPALRDGKPTATVLRREHQFVGGVESDSLTTSADWSLLNREKKKPETIVSAGKLDAPLKPTIRRTPDFPGLLYGKVAVGEATVEFLVDEDGHARLPRVVSATEEAFGFAAVQAIATWQFEPPLSGGKPAVVRVQVPVKFAPPATKSDKPASK